MPTNSACRALGDRANMLAQLDVAERNLDPPIRWINLDPVFDRYRSDPAFQAIAKRATTPH